MPNELEDRVFDLETDISGLETELRRIETELLAKIDTIGACTRTLQKVAEMLDQRLNIIERK